MEARPASIRLRRRATLACAAVGSATLLTFACGDSDGATAMLGTAGVDGGGAGGLGGAPFGGASAADAAGGSGEAGGTVDAADDAPAAEDAPGDVSAEPAEDAGPDGPTGENVCGDGWRDPIDEECDDGNGSNPPDSCSSDCRVTDLLPVFGPMPEAGTIPDKMHRKLGLGRHPIGAGDAGFAIAFVDYLKVPADINLKLFGPKGAPLPGIITLASGMNQISDADPVVAALPGGKFAVAWTDANADGDGRGIAFRIVDPAVPPTSQPGHANTVTAQNQEAPDILWTGSEIVVVWQDAATTGPMNLSDVRARRFSSSGTALGSEDVAATLLRETQPALARFGSGWAVAWRAQSTVAPEESIGVKSGSAVWSVGPFMPGPIFERPALVELDATRLLVVFSETTIVGGQNVPRLRGALLDTQAPGSVQRFSIEPLIAGYSALPQYEPNVARVGDRIYVAWRSAGIKSWPDGEIWLKEVHWSSAGATLDLSGVELEIPREPAHRVGPQRRPALAAAPLWPEGALVTAWEDFGQVFGAIEGTPDFVVSFVPTPILRIEGDGGLGK
jgi:hypothetical protein